MGRKAKWFDAVKKVFGPESKAKKDENSKKKWTPAAPSHPDPSSSASLEDTLADPTAPPLPHPEEIEPSKDGHSVASVTVAAAEDAAGKSREEMAAVKIQTAFRGYLARRALRALKGLVRMRSLVHGGSVKRQATSTLRCMQTLARVQSQIRSRRLRMSAGNQALQRQLLLQRDRELESLGMGEEWDDSLQSREQIEASLANKQEAALRRERALAYAFSHQLKSSSTTSADPMFIDPNNPQWGWSWLERWMAARPDERRSGVDKDTNADHASVKSTSHNTGGDVARACAHQDRKPDKASPTTPKPIRPASQQSPSMPSSKPTVTVKSRSIAAQNNGFSPADGDARTAISIQSERPRRHSISSASVRDDESLASSPAAPSYMAPTESARAKSRFQSASSADKAETPAKGGYAGSINKRLSFAAGMRRHSGPPKVEIVVKEVEP